MRVPDDVARRLRAGHPWVYREALVRPPPWAAGHAVEVVDAEGRLVGRGLYDPAGTIAIRLFTGERGEPIDAALVRARVAAARAVRAGLPSDLTAFRVLNGEGDGLPGATCDRYGDYLVVQLHASLWEPFEAALLDALEEAHRPAGVYVQRRYALAGFAEADAPRPGAAHARGRTAPVEVLVTEAGLAFAVDVTAPLAPGLATDLREARLLAGAHAAGRRALCVFSYAGGFALHALRGGAASVTAIDALARSHAAARRSMQASGLDEGRCELIVGDALATLERLAARGARFDLAILDPPSFAAGRARPFATGREYADLVRGTVAVLAEGGLLGAASTAQRLGADEFERACADGGARAGAVLRVLERRSLPPDYPTLAALPESAHLKFALLRGL